MTIKNMTWAMEDAPIDNPQQLAVLIVLADRAMDGIHAWPSHDYIAHRARMSTRSVQRTLTELEDVGVIRRCTNPEHGFKLSRIPMGRRPILWSLNTAAVREQPIGEVDASGGCGWTSGDNELQGGVTQETARGDTCVGRVPNTKPDREPNKYLNEFENEFWPLYPRKLSKAKARKIWPAARRAAALDVILKGLQSYVEYTKDTEQKFIKHPTTWLSGECWNDEFESSGSRVSSVLFDSMLADGKVDELYELANVARPAIRDFGDVGALERGELRKKQLRDWAAANRDQFVS